MTTILYLFFSLLKPSKSSLLSLSLADASLPLSLGKEKQLNKHANKTSPVLQTQCLSSSVSFPIQYSDFPPCTFLSPNSDPQLVKSSLTCSKTFLQPIFLLNLYISSFSIIHPKQEQNITTSTPKKHHPGSSSCSSMFPCSNLS